MRYLDLTLPSLPENLALDEALLTEAETSTEPLETLRIWESDTLGVIVGRSTPVAEIKMEACRAKQVPVLRRISGGAAVVVGPGCLMFSLVFSFRLRPELRSLDKAHAFVLGKFVDAFSQKVDGIAMRGTCDLTIGDKKFSGNAVRVKRDYLLYHGTLLYNFPLDTVSELLAMPRKWPDYRQEREHGAFVTNLPMQADAIREALRTAWNANEPCADWPRAETARLTAEKYSQREWNEQL